jgi:hypothetical protein
MVFLENTARNLLKPKKMRSVTTYIHYWVVLRIRISSPWGPYADARAIACF